MTSEALIQALQEARDLLVERKHGSAARSPAHNARLVIDAALAAWNTRDARSEPPIAGGGGDAIDEVAEAHHVLNLYAAPTHDEGEEGGPLSVAGRIEAKLYADALATPPPEHIVSGGGRNDADEGSHYAFCDEPELENPAPSTTGTGGTHSVKAPMKMLVDADWLRRRVETDPDLDTEACSVQPPSREGAESGWVLVPRVPTKEMMEAWRLCVIRNSRPADPKRPFESPFTCMVAVAPPPTSEVK